MIDFSGPKREIKISWRPPPRLRISEWAARYRYLSPEASAEPGLWNHARAPHLVLPMDYLSPHHSCERVVCKFSSQSGKTELLLTFAGYIIDLDPGPVLVVQPNVTPMGEAFSKDRVAPMLRDSPALAEKVGKARARASASTVLHKTFPGGHLTIAGANSPSSLASRPIRYLICDELDRWEITKEGDPLMLARKRLQTFRVRRSAKEVIASTPTFADLGVCAEYERCSQQWEWHLGCQHCDATQFPSLAHFRWTDGDARSIRYACQSCGAEYDLGDADRIKQTGRWVLAKDGPDTSAGFWFCEWSSPFSRWDDTLAEWLAAGDDPARRQVVTNTAFAQAWEGEGEKIVPAHLASRAEDWGEALPDGAVAITMGCDVQGDRLEIETVAWGPGYESWSLAYDVLPGEPTSEEVWADLLDLYRRPWARGDGGRVKPVALCIDSGAYTQHVYACAKRARDRGIIPIKGVSGMERDAISGDRRQRLKRVSARLRDGRPPEILGVDSIKRTIFHHLSAAPGQTGYCHFPTGRAGEYYAQLTGERLMVVTPKGRRPERRWVPIHPAVEALDCRVYAYAALLLSGAALGAARPPGGMAKVAEPPRAVDATPGDLPGRSRRGIKRKTSTWL